MNLVKTSLLNGIAVLIKMLTLLGINKVLAIYAGPNGYALLGQFQNIIQMITTFANGAINTGVVRYTSEYEDLPEEQRLIWVTAFNITLIGSFIFTILIFIFKAQLAMWLFRDPSFESIFNWFALTLVFLCLNTFFLSILNGKKEVKKYVLANIGGSLVSLLLTICLSKTLGFYGVVLALATYQAAAFVFTFYICYSQTWFKKDFFLGRIDKDSLRKLSKYTAMSLTSALSVPLSQIAVRELIASNLGWQNAGLWEAVNKFSSAYLLFITSTLSVYYLPKLAGLKNREDLRNEVVSVYRIIVPFAALGAIILYFFRDLIINLLFAESFLGMNILFSWQVVGDFFKICSWILGYIYIAKGLTRLYIASEILISLAAIFTTYFFINNYGVEGMSMAYSLAALLHLVFVFTSIKLKKII